MWACESEDLPIVPGAPHPAAHRLVEWAHSRTVGGVRGRWVIGVAPKGMNVRFAVDKVRFTLDWTRALVETLGWRYEVWSGSPDVLVRNVRFLAGFRNPDRFDPELVKAIHHQSISDTNLGQVLDHDLGEPPWRVRAAVLHLVWCQALEVDITVPLSKASPLVKGKCHVC